ncbi:hypothetical protein [Aureispira anguillae]|uniref:Uncharacterized protein n=1 Tax=Aureispira anguillae TaxID=2864201 RepID=A0A915YLN9_9BACT|nr:hypothetical protein [Aureispira anguillae]BDS15048.1 hypothetical protein AsAng_0058300 [Aureispira anguillae]
MKAIYVITGTVFLLALGTALAETNNNKTSNCCTTDCCPPTCCVDKDNSCTADCCQ